MKEERTVAVVKHGDTWFVGYLAGQYLQEAWQILQQSGLHQTGPSSVSIGHTPVVLHGILGLPQSQTVFVPDTALRIIPSDVSEWTTRMEAAEREAVRQRSGIQTPDPQPSIDLVR